MCHRFVPLSSDEVREALAALADTGHATLEAVTTSSPSDAWPGSTVTAIVAKGNTFDALDLVWGFYQPHRDQQRRSSLVFNTRIETAISQAQSGVGMWSHAIHDGRCLVPVRGFFEPAGRGRSDAFFSSPESSVFLLAGLFEADRLSIVTTQANEAVSLFHHRMPLVLRRGESRVWLGPEFARLADRSEVPLITR